MAIIMCQDPGSRQIGQCTDPDRLASLARCLGKCKSTPDLSFMAVSLLTKTLTARATRLETSASKARLAADKEAFRTTSVNKRRRDSGPKNASQFIRQTIRNRHNKAGDKKDMEERLKQSTARTELPFSGDTTTVACPSRTVFQPRRQGPWSSTPSLLPQRADAGDCSVKDSIPPATTGVSRNPRRARSAGARRRETTTTAWLDDTYMERSSLLDRRACDIRRRDSWNLEDDADIRILLDIEQSASSSASNTCCDAKVAGGFGANHDDYHRGSRCSVQTSSRPASCGRHDRFRAAIEAAQNNPLSTSGKGYMPKPRTAARRSRSEAETSSMGKGLGRSDRGQQLSSRGGMLGRGGVVTDGAEVQQKQQQPFEMTAMGRKVRPLRRTADKAERWLPAKTLNGLDRLQRSRMLASKRPEVTGPSAWAERRGRRQGGPAQRGHVVPRGPCTRWLK